MFENPGPPLPSDADAHTRNYSELIICFPAIDSLASSIGMHPNTSLNMQRKQAWNYIISIYSVLLLLFKPFIILAVLCLSV